MTESTTTATPNTMDSTTTNDKDNHRNTASPTSVQDHAASAQRAITAAAERAMNRDSTTTSTTTNNNGSLLDTRYGWHIPEDKVQAYVQTPYGKGLVLRTRHDPTTNAVVSRDVELLAFGGSNHAKQDEEDPHSSSARIHQQRRGRVPMLHSAINFPSVAPQVGDDVTCLYGRGMVKEIRKNNTNTTTTMVHLQLSDWRLAQRSKVTCVLPVSHVQVVRPKVLYEMSVWERVELAQRVKEHAKTLFQQQQYKKALEKYAVAVDAVRYVQHKTDSDNYIRADLLVVMMTCCNNAATCAAALHQYELVSKYAHNALVLIDALQEKAMVMSGATSSRILQILIRDGYTQLKLFGEYKCKSYLLLAKAALLHQDDPIQALEYIQTARTIVKNHTSKNNNEKDKFKVLQSTDKQLQRLAVQCKERKKALLAKEKQRAQAMFGTTTTTKTTTKDDDTTTKGVDKTARSASPETQQPTPIPTAETDPTVLSPPASIKKQVTFEDGSSPGDDAPVVPWYVEHQELILLTVGVMAGIGLTKMVWNATTMMGSRKR